MKLNKVPTPTVTVGQTVKGNLIGGAHVVAEIRTVADQMKNQSTEFCFYNGAGELFFVGRKNSKATLI